MFKKLINKIFGNKSINDINKDILKRCKKEFDNYQDEENGFYGSMNELYKYIKDIYLERLNEGKLDIKIERIRIKNSLGNYKKTSEKLDSINIVLITSCITTIINMLNSYFKSKVESGDLSREMSIDFGLFVVVGVMCLTVRAGEKSSAYERDLVNHISLKVLDDIENGIIE